MSRLFRFLCLLIGFFVLLLTTNSAVLAAVPSSSLVISQIKTAGADGLLDEFIEIYNPTDKTVALANWSLQYKSGNSLFATTSVSPLPLNAVIPPFGYYLVRPLGQPQSADANYSGFTLEESAGNVFLVNNSTQLTAATNASIIDRLAYGATADSPEHSPASAPAVSQSLERLPGADLGEGNAIDTGKNGSDFLIRAIAKPRLSTVTTERFGLPIISNLSPSTNSYVTNQNVILKASISDGSGSGILASGVLLWLDNKAVNSVVYNATAGELATPLTLTEGTHTARLEVTDRAGYTTTVAWSFTVDTVAPIVTVQLNDQAKATANRMVLVQSFVTEGPSGVASGVSQMQISYDGIFDTEPWEVYRSTFSSELPTGDGVKTVWLRVRDLAGQLSNSATATIAFESNPPALPTEVIFNLEASGSKFIARLIWQSDPKVASYVVRYSDGTVLFGPFTTTANNYAFEGLESGRNYRYEVASVSALGTVSSFVQAVPKSEVKKPTVLVTPPVFPRPEFPTGGPIEEPTPTPISKPLVISPSPKATEVTVSPSPTVSPAIKGSSDNQPRDWTRVIVAISLLIIAAGLATGGWYLYQWWTTRPADKGKGGRW